MAWCLPAKVVGSVTCNGGSGSVILGTIWRQKILGVFAVISFCTTTAVGMVVNLGNWGTSLYVETALCPRSERPLRFSLMLGDGSTFSRHAITTDCSPGIAVDKGIDVLPCLELKKRLLHGKSSGVSSESVTCHDPVARNNDRNRVSSVGLADGPRGSWMTDSLG